jgi:aryl-alcohol dehydrogenase-like predicted oxidoreductase
MPPSLPTRKIGAHDVSAIGYGAMGMSVFYGTVDSDEERFKVCSAAVPVGGG